MTSFVINRGIWGALLAVALLAGAASIALAPTSAYAAEGKPLAPGATTIASLSAQAGSNVAQATALAPNAAATGTISDWDDEDWYKITLPSAGKFQVVMSGDYSDSGAGWNVSLRDNANTVMWEGWHYADSIVPETMHTTGLPAGTYYIRVYGGEDGLSYRLTPKFFANSSWETEFNDNIVEADAISLGKPINGTMRGYNDEDWYKVKLPSSGKLQIIMSGDYHGDGSWWHVSLMSIANSQMWGGYHYTESLVPETMHTASLPAGTYFIRVYGSDENLVYQLTPKFTANAPAANVTASKAQNPMRIATKTVTVKYKKIKKAKRTVKPISVTKYQGSLSYAKLSGSKKISVNAKTGAFTVKKGTKRGTYKVKVRVAAKGNGRYLSKTATVAVKIVVK